MHMPRFFTCAILLMLGAALAGCAGHPPRPVPVDVSQMNVTGARRDVVSTALAQVGNPYEYGGETPDGFDCSGLVQYAYAHAGVRLPRTTADQWHAGRHVSLHDARPGDLLFYRVSHNWSGLHVGIYVGDGHMVQASTSLGRVHVSDVGSAFWRGHFLSAVQVLP